MELQFDLAQGYIFQEIYTLEIPEKILCPFCKEKLHSVDEGVWECQSCNYYQFINITECAGEACENLIFSAKYIDLKTGNVYFFMKLKEKYCQEDKWGGGTCLIFAQCEIQEMEYIDIQIRSILKTHDPHCDCEGCRCY